MALAQRRSPAPQVDPAKAAAEATEAAAKLAEEADRAGRSDEHPDVENLTVVEHKLTVVEPSANPWQVLSEARLRAMDRPTIRAIVGLRNYHPDARGHRGVAKLDHGALIRLILASQPGDSRLHDPNASVAGVVGPNS